MSVEKKIKELKIVIPELAKPVGSYVPAVKTGDLVMTSGQLPFSEGRLLFKGRVGKEVTLENAEKATKQAVVNALAAIKWLVGDLSKIKKIVRLNGFVCSAVGFNDQAKVMNAASDLLVQIFGEEIGSHTRVALGVLELPMSACVELDLTVSLK